MFCTIWYHMYNIKNVKNTHRRIIPLGKLLKPATVLKASLHHGCFFRFLNCANDNKLRKESQIKLLYIIYLLLAQQESSWLPYLMQIARQILKNCNFYKRITMTLSICVLWCYFVNLRTLESDDIRLVTRYDCYRWSSYCRGNEHP